MTTHVVFVALPYILFVFVFVAFVCFSDDEKTTHVVVVASAYILHMRLHPSLSPSTHAGNLRSARFLKLC